MKYSRFEALILGVGAVAILGSMLFTYSSAPVAEEIIAQVLLLGVLIAAAHWGRNGGFVAASLASLVYILIRIPLVMETGFLSVELAILLVTRVVTYGLVGIVGGDLCSRARYLFARLEGADGIDEWSQVYNQTMIVRSAEQLLGQHRRYGTPGSIVLVALSPLLFQDLRPTRQRSLVRGVARYMRNDIRLVDEIGRLDDGRFMICLPHTPGEGAQVVGSRVHAGTCSTLGAKEESVVVTVVSVPADLQQVEELLTELSPAPATTQASAS